MCVRIGDPPPQGPAARDKTGLEGAEKRRGQQGENHPIGSLNHVKIPGTVVAYR